MAVKAGPATSTDCRTAAGYGNAQAIAGVASFDEPVPRQEGVYVLCGATVDGDGAVSTGSAGYAVMQVDGTAPTIRIELAVTTAAGDDASVEPVFSPPELSSFDVTIGPRDETDCSDLDGYFTYRRIPIVIPLDQLPAVVCVIGEDEAGNRGEPQQFEVP